MPTELQIIRACEFIRVGAQGDFDFENTRATLATLVEACRKRGVDRALLDVRGAISNLTSNDLANLVNAFGDAAGTKRMRLAILHSDGQNERARLFAFFSALRGRKVRAVQTFEEGFEWLSSQVELGEESEDPNLAVPILTSEQRAAEKPEPDVKIGRNNMS